MTAPKRALAKAEPRALPSAAASDEAGSVLAMIERAARDPSIDLDRMERLMTMHRDLKADQARVAFNAALTAAQAEMPRVMRDATNSHTNSRYARLETIHKAITPVITRHGFSLSFDTADSDKPGHHRVVCTVAHAGGHSRQHSADLPADGAGAQGKANKTGIQAFGSTVSYGRRYLTLLIFNIALTLEDNDGNNQAGPSVGDDQLAELQDLIELIGVAGDDLARFLQVMKAETVAEIPAARFDEAMRRLRKFGEITR